MNRRPSARGRKADANRLAFAATMLATIRANAGLTRTDLQRMLRGGHWMERSGGAWSFGPLVFNQTLNALVGHHVVDERDGRPRGGGYETRYYPVDPLRAAIRRIRQGQNA